MLNVRGLMDVGITRFPVVTALTLLLCSLGSTPGARQRSVPDACWIRGNASEVGARPSALDSAAVALDGGTIKVCYGRPKQHGRTVMGELVPFGAPWRLGANEATAIHVPFPARIGGTDVAPGWYSLFVIPEAKQWRFVVNGDAQRWGVPINDEVRAKDIGSTVVPVERLEKPVETLTITLHRTSNSAAAMDVSWENTRVSIPVARR